MAKTWYSESQEGLVLHLHIQPRASKTEIVGTHGDRLKIRIASPPVDGEANEEIMRFLAEMLEIPRKQVRLLRGAAGRQKDVQCLGVSPDQMKIKITDKIG